MARVNERLQREEVEIPELRIVEQPLWGAAKARQAEASFKMGRDEDGRALNRRPVFLLSGLLTCGLCGGGYTIVGRDRYGCARRRASGTCDNGSTITRQAVERRVLGGLRERMLTPELLEEFVRSFEAELARARQAAAADARVAADRLADVERRLEGVLRAVEDGAWSQSVQARLIKLERSKAAQAAQLAAAEAAPSPVRLHPDATKRARRCGV